MKGAQSGARRNIHLWLVIFILAIIVAIGIINYLGFLGLHFLLGPFFSHHWMSWIGASYLIIFIPVQRYLKVTHKGSYKTLSRFHIYGNLISAGLITVHFSQHLSRPPEAFPDLGTGLLLYIILFTLIITGIILRFSLFATRRSWWRYLHSGVTTAFFLIVLIHILQGLNII